MMHAFDWLLIHDLLVDRRIDDVPINLFSVFLYTTFLYINVAKIGSLIKTNQNTRLSKHRVQKVSFDVRKLFNSLKIFHKQFTLTYEYE